MTPHRLMIRKKRTEEGKLGVVEKEEAGNNWPFSERAPEGSFGTNLGLRHNTPTALSPPSFSDPFPRTVAMLSYGGRQS